MRMEEEIPRETEIQHTGQENVVASPAHPEGENVNAGDAD